MGLETLKTTLVNEKTGKSLTLKTPLIGASGTYGYVDEYEDFIDELYISAIQNPLYRNVLKNVGSKYILHAMGEISKDETVFSRFEFEYELNALKAYVQANY